MRKAERWVRANLDVRWLNPTDRQGETVVWSEKAVRPDGGGALDVIGRIVAHTYLDVFLARAGAIIEDKQIADADVLAELRDRGLMPR